MPESAADRDSLQVGKHKLSPPSLPFRAIDGQDAVVIIPALADPPELADDGIPGLSRRHSVCTDITGVDEFYFVGYVSSVCLGDRDDSAADLWFRLAGIRPDPRAAITASLGDDEVLDDFRNLEVVGSVDIEKHA